MFGFLKKKLKDAVDKFTKKAEDEADVIEEVEEITEVEVKEKPKKKDKSKEKESKPIKIEQKEKEETKEIKKESIEKTIAVDEEKEEIKVNESIKEKEIKENIAHIEDDVDEPVIETKEESIKEKDVEVKSEKKEGFLSKIFKKKPKVDEEIIEETIKYVKEETKDDSITDDKEEIENEKVSVEESTVDIEKEDIIEEEEEPVKEEKKGFFQKITETVTKVSLSDKKFEELFWELEITLLENNVAVEVIEKIKDDLKNDLVNNKINRKDLDKQIIKSLRTSISGLFNVEQIDLIKNARKKKPYVIVFVGINGVGKTTNLAKVAYLLKKQGLSVVAGACDTFRAAAIQQLEEHTKNVGIKLIKHDYGSDPAAVAFDTIKHAEGKNIDVVLLDTAGRLHSNKNLMQELEKVVRITKPDLKIFVGESLAGNDVVEQVKLFNDSVGIDAIILSKADTDEKGGAAISVSYVTGKPILFLGVGQTYDDLEVFDKDKMIEKIGL
jgi:fused signal recognition particle receptor